ncbi:MAG: lmo0937 family membrane protein [Capsulimonadaceae bacterium]
MSGMLWTVISVLFVVWMISFAMSFGGPSIHYLLAAAVVLALFNLTVGRRMAH